MAGIQTFGLFFLLMAALYGYYKGKTVYLLAGCAAQVLLTFSSGNGIIASGCVALLSLASMAGFAKAVDPQHEVVKKRHTRAALVSAITALVCCPLYFVHYHPVTSGCPRASFSTALGWFFHFLSNHIYFDDYSLSVAAGVVIFAGLVFFLSRYRSMKNDARTAPFLALLLFVLLTMMVAAVFRSGLGPYIPSRYLIYPHLAAALLYVLLAARLQRGRLFVTASVLYTVVMLIAYNMNFRGGVKDMARLHANLVQPGYFYPDSARAMEIADTACALKIYCMHHAR